MKIRLKTILCYGDSNTWGYDAKNDSRFDRNDRWTGKLQVILGDAYHVVENGVCGRTTAFSTLEEPFVNGCDDAKNAIRSNAPLDYCVIMLGTNDTKKVYNKSMDEIQDGMERLITIFSQEWMWNDLLNQKVNILLVTPPCIRNLSKSPFLDEFGVEAERKSKKMSIYLCCFAKKRGLAFLDTSEEILADEYDGIHLNKEGHKLLATCISEKIWKMERKENYG